MNQKVIDSLIKKGIINKEQLALASEEARKTAVSLEMALQKLGVVSDIDIAQAQSAILGVPFIDLTDYLIDSDTARNIPENIARKFKAIPIFKTENSLTVAMSDPQNVVAVDEIKKICKCENVDTVLATESAVLKSIDHFYTTSSVQEAANKIDKDFLADKPTETKDDLALQEAANEAPIIKLVNLLVMEALNDSASDIHIEPQQDKVLVRVRIDGILHEAYNFEKNIHLGVISRIKVLARMDISETRKPQDGRIQFKINEKDIDIRVSTFPTIYGENVVLRLLDKASVVLGLADLGFLDKELEGFEKLIRRPNGIILVTGPTGSGKTTTLYAALSTINSVDKNIITIEDPVEYELPLIRQTQVNPKAELTFANGLRSILRQDPDIIMVGEIRDSETASIAIQAAMTGHLVFSTLHTNDSVSSLTRLIDMGVEPFLISSTIIGVLAQRLVRRICQNCKVKYQPDQQILKDLDLQLNSELYKGSGCVKCKNTGYKSRIGIFELLIMNEEIKKIVLAKASTSMIKEQAVKDGMRTLKDDGRAKIGLGITSAEEILRVTREE